MNIAFDAAAILGASRQRGMGYYVKQLMCHMIKQDKSNKYYFFNCLEPYHLFAEARPNLQEDYFYLGNKLMLGEHRELNCIYSNLLRRYLRDNNIDVFIITVPFAIGPGVRMPQGGHLPLYEENWFEGCRVVAIAYDLIPKLFSDLYLRSSAVAENYERQHKQLQWVDHILSISQCTKSDLVKYSQIPETRITCIWGGFKESIGKIGIKDADWAYLGEAYGIRPGFIMAPLGEDPRKNRLELLKAYSALPLSLRLKHQLVIVCAMSKAGAEQMQTMAKDLGCEETLVITDFVPDEVMNRLYNMAYLVAFPSQYEGFGMPIVEGFACGTPVLTSANSSCGEVAGNAAYLVDPFSIEDMTRGLLQALDENDREKMVQRGEARLKKYQWNNVAKSALKALSGLAPLGESNDQVVKQPSFGLKRIAFFSSLPPIPSGISDYSVDILHELSRFYDIDVFIDDGYEADCDLPKNVRVYNHHCFLAERYNEVFFQYGNNPYHVYMDEYIREYGGVLELHDVNLAGMLLLRYVQRNHDFEGYHRAILHDLLDTDANRLMENIKKHIYPQVGDNILNGYVVDYADKVIVHSVWGEAMLKKRNIACQVRQIPLYAKLDSPVVTKLLARKRLNLSTKAEIIATFGNITEAKRPIIMLEAIAALHKEFPQTRLYFVGNLRDEVKDDFMSVLRKYGMEDYVTVTGYTDLETFEEFMMAADICVQMRFPYNGENSGSLCRLMGKGKCVIVNAIGSFGELPDDVCVKLPSADKISRKEEIENLYSAIVGLLSSKNKITNYGEKARIYAEAYLDIRKCVQQMREFIDMPWKKPVLTEEKLERIHSYIESGNYTEEQISGLADTLAYAGGEYDR